MSNGHALILEITSNWIIMKKIVYVDMDNVLVDFQSAFPKLSKKVLNEYENNKTRNHPMFFDDLLYQ